MPPPKKRPRAMAAKEDSAVAATPAPQAPAVDGPVDASSSLPFAALDQIDAVVGDLLGHLQPTASNKKTAIDGKKIEKLQDGLFALKALQNDLFANLRKTEETLKEKKAVQERKERRLEGLHYEQQQLQTEIAECQNFKMTYLKRLLEDEQVESMPDFLKADVTDPSHKQRIVRKLQLEINARGTLQRDVQAKEKQLAQLQDQVKKKKAFLASLPNHLASIERASMPLQKTMYGSINSDSKTKGLRMNGTDRLARLEAARNLSCLPLYTLFASLQHYIDQQQQQQQQQQNFSATASGQDHNDDDDGNDDGNDDDVGSSISTRSMQNLSLAVVTTGSNGEEVLLHIPVPDVVAHNNNSNNNQRARKITIHFQYNEEKDGVAATVRCGLNSLYQDLVLEELFPNQTQDNSSNVKSNHDKDNDNVYSWSNYLAGIHHLEADVSQVSVRAIVRMLCRRIRANVTLKSILSSLQRQQVVPTLPDYATLVVDNKNSSTSSTFSYTVEHACKLSEFVSEQQDKDDRTNSHPTVEMVYKAVLRKGPQQLAIQVKVHKARYPEVPPVWTLNNTEEGATPLYDEKLAGLEQNVNVELLEAVRDASELTQEWILVHQLHMIMEGWDSW